AVQIRAKGAEAARWESSEVKTAAAYQNGFVIGLQPGVARVRVGAGAKDTAECIVTVKEFNAPLIDPATLKQYDDNRKFTVDGRVCYGSELNGRRATDPEERENLESNRVLNPKPANKEKDREWEMAAETEVYDGAGILMGTIPADLKTDDGRMVPTGKFNFGMSKVMNGRAFLYGFSIRIKPSDALRKILSDEEKVGGTVSTSAWVPLDSVIDKETLLERVGVGKVSLPRMPLEKKGLRITGGNPKQYHTEHGEVRIVKDPTAEPVPSHYLRRPSGTVNIIYSVPGFGLGGQGLDSLLVGNNILFRPAKGAKVFVQPTYYPDKHPLRGKVSPMKMTFIYGAAEVKGVEPVYGWVAREALEGVK
ncbi:MAG: hypothetical protein M3478_01800, partial [Planctomycetota bacterium]|nr:hypothetical protein [Planctomycetota bacterium]